jgi:hypothetical protein
MEGRMTKQIIPRVILFVAFLVFTPVIGICGSKTEGTYTNTGGMVTLDLKAGGKANFTMMGETIPCKYTVKGDKVALHDDGSLTGPGFIGSMKQSK